MAEETDRFDPRPVTLDGRFVRLEPLSLEHVEGLWSISRHASIWTWWLAEQWASIGDARAEVEATLGAMARGERIAFVAIDEASGRVAGTTSFLTIRRENRGLEIGYTWLGVEFQRTAINTECKLLLLTHAFEDLGAVRVELKTDALNEPSRKAIERVGAKFEGVLRSYQKRHNETWRDTAMYSMTREEWPGVKAGLQSRLSA